MDLLLDLIDEVEPLGQDHWNILWTGEGQSAGLGGASSWLSRAARATSLPGGLIHLKTI